MRIWNSLRFRGLIAAIALAAAMPLADARGQATPSGETVVVTGRRLTEQEALTAVSRFVTAHASFTMRIKQIARWGTPVCPKVANLPKEFGDFIVARIKAVARAVRAPMKEPCAQNVTIFYTPRPQEAMDWIAENRPALLGFHFNSQTADLARVTRPIQAWYVTATNDVIDDAYHPPPAGVSGSRLSNSLSAEILHVLIVVNSEAIAGQEIGPIADYIAMLALSQASAPDDCTQLPTILNYLSPGCPAANIPKALTTADQAYLEGLYIMSADALGRLQRAQILNHMERSLGDSDAGAPAGTAAQ